MDSVKLTSHPLSVDEIIEMVRDSSCGAVSLFIGTTRDHFQDKKVCRLEYEAYEDMAVKEIKRICMDSRGKWNVKNIAVYHRYLFLFTINYI